MIQIPKFFHEILGESQTKSALLVIALFTIISGAAASTLGFADWIHLSFVKQLVTWILFLDIAGGVVANFTKGTDLFYHRHPEKRWIFIAVHVQPVLLAWSMELPLSYGFLIYGFTFLCAAVLNICRQFSIQPLLAASFTAFGFIIIAYIGNAVPFLAAVLFTFYIFKVLFSFSVFHHKGELT